MGSKGDGGCGEGEGGLEGVGGKFYRLEFF